MMNGIVVRFIPRIQSERRGERERFHDGICPLVDLVIGRPWVPRRRTARSAASVRLCALAGVDVVYHTSFAAREMRRCGTRVLPGGDYGFAWTPHGTYAGDLAHFVNLFGYTAKESLLAATALGGEMMGYPETLGKVQPGYYADVILVDGDPLEDIEIFQDRSGCILSSSTATFTRMS
ncbi:putative amidohydrolase protein [Rosellinia necatrix]|uniref:Putative amidohydrolase protein n=1 Tax=Rosellinia necatrix TaxID=77044 RepID=A0A1W2TJ76_ROSNE|nr:putative amidohydrolase protein [Rosellinia necatrix]